VFESAETEDDDSTIVDIHARCGMVQCVSWTELYKIRIITYNFLRAYTLAKYREWKIDVEMEPDEICRVVGDLATLLGGKDLENVGELNSEAGLIVLGITDQSFRHDDRSWFSDRCLPEDFAAQN
jgi:hypothetical protein